MRRRKWAGLFLQALGIEMAVGARSFAMDMCWIAHQATGLGRGGLGLSSGGGQGGEEGGEFGRSGVNLAGIAYLFSLAL